MKDVKTIMALLMAVVMSMTLVSCGDDEDEIPTYSNYFVECTRVEGGGLTKMECVNLQANINSEITDSDMAMEGITRDAAVALFDRLIQAIASDYSTMRPEVPLYITFTMRTENGVTVKSSTLVVTKDGCQVN